METAKEILYEAEFMNPYEGASAREEEKKASLKEDNTIKPERKRKVINTKTGKKENQKENKRESKNKKEIFNLYNFITNIRNIRNYIITLLSLIYKFLHFFQFYPFTIVYIIWKTN